MINETKESVYDREIAPLMAKIIEVCKREDIAMVADFELDANEDCDDDPLMCTTCIVPETACTRLKQAAALLRPKSRYAAMVIKRARGAES